MIERHTASKCVPSVPGVRRKGPTCRMRSPSTGSASVRWAIARRAPRAMVGGFGNGTRETGATETRWVPIESFGTHRITIARRGDGHQSLESDAITVAIRVPGFPDPFHVCPCRGPVGSSRSSSRPHRAAGDPHESGGHLRDDHPPLTLMWYFILSSAQAPEGEIRLRHSDPHTRHSNAATNR